MSIMDTIEALVCPLNVKAIPTLLRIGEPLVCPLDVLLGFG